MGQGRTGKACRIGEALEVVSSHFGFEMIFQQKGCHIKSCLFFVHHDSGVLRLLTISQLAQHLSCVVTIHSRDQQLDEGDYA